MLLKYLLANPFLCGALILFYFSAILTIQKNHTGSTVSMTPRSIFMTLS